MNGKLFCIVHMWKKDGLNLGNMKQTFSKKNRIVNVFPLSFIMSSWNSENETDSDDSLESENYEFTAPVDICLPNFLNIDFK